MILHHRTPLFHYRHTGHDGEVMVKMECLQPSGSFKIRGIGRLCSKAVADGHRSFISSSGGNAGLAVAYAGRMLNAEVTVVVPETTPSIARSRIEAEGAKVIVHGASWAEANAYSLELAEEKRALHVHPFDHPLLWEGHSSIMDEVVEDGYIPDVIVLSVGGGGLLSGVVAGLDRHKLNHVSILAVETEGAASLATSLEKGRRVTLNAITSRATTLGAKQVAQRAFEVMQRDHYRSKVVSDAEACSASVRFADTFRILVEPACGASLALLHRPDVLERGSKVLVIGCGGAGVAADDIAAWRQEFRV